MFELKCSTGHYRATNSNPRPVFFAVVAIREVSGGGLGALGEHESLPNLLLIFKKYIEVDIVPS